jgi:ATP-binding protein involved in chromosome partitioning
MSLDDSEVQRALASVVDPQLRRDIVELGMVRSTRVRRGRVSVALALPVAPHPGRDELLGRVRGALEAVPGVRSIEVELTTMGEGERAALRRTLRGAGAAPGSADRTNPFTAPGSRTRVLGISSGKGGVGKSSVTVNTAIALARLGHKVSVLDADVYGFSVPKMLGIDHDPLVIDDLLVPPVAHGVGCMSIGFFVEDQQPVMWRGPMLHKALEQFLVDVHWDDPDFLVVDMPPGTGDVAMSMSQYLPKAEVFVVTTPQAAAQRVAQRSALMAKKLKLVVRGVVENMSWFTGDDGKRYEIFGSGGGGALAEDLDVPLVGQVPLAPALRSGGDDGRPVTVTDPAGEASRAFEEMAKRIDAMGPARIYRRELAVR